MTKKQESILLKAAERVLVNGKPRYEAITKPEDMVTRITSDYSLFDLIALDTVRGTILVELAPDPVLGALKSRDTKALTSLLISKKELNLSYLKLTSEELLRLTEALQSIDTLTTLTLRSCEIGDKGAEVIRGFLKSNNTIVNLNLCRNAISDDGAKYIGEGFESNSALKLLNLNDNPIGDAGAGYLSECIKSNYTLTSLEFTGQEGMARAHKTIIGETTRRNEGLLWYKTMLAKIKAPLLEAIQSDNSNQIGEARKPLLEYQRLVNKYLAPHAVSPAKDERTGLDDTYDNCATFTAQHFLRLKGVCKGEGNPLWHHMPLELKSKILSYLEPCSLALPPSPKLGNTLELKLEILSYCLGLPSSKKSGNTCDVGGHNLPSPSRSGTKDMQGIFNALSLLDQMDASENTFVEELPDEEVKPEINLVGEDHIGN